MQGGSNISGKGVVGLIKNACKTNIQKLEIKQNKFEDNSPFHLKISQRILANEFNTFIWNRYVIY